MFESLEEYMCLFKQQVWASLVAQLVKNPPLMQEIWVRFFSQEDPLEKEMATHSSILAWRILWTEEPGRLQSIGYKELDTTEAIEHSTAHIGIQISLCDSDFNYFGYIPTIVLLYHMIILFSISWGTTILFWRTAIHSGYTILHFNQKHTRVPISPHSC